MKSNLGTPLSREQQKQIKGGLYHCHIGDYALCYTDSGTECDVVTWEGETAAGVCGQGNYVFAFCYTDPDCSDIDQTV